MQISLFDLFDRYVQIILFFSAGPDGQICTCPANIFTGLTKKNIYIHILYIYIYIAKYYFLGLLRPKKKMLSLILMSFQTCKNFVHLQNTI